MATTTQICSNGDGVLGLRMLKCLYESLVLCGRKTRAEKEKKRKSCAKTDNGDDDIQYLGKVIDDVHGLVHKVRHKPTGVTAAFKNNLSWEEKEILNHLWRPQSFLPSIIYFSQAPGKGGYYGLECVKTNLRRYMDTEKQDGFTINEVKKLTKQLLEGVKFLHENGVVHRDLKPNNILITQGGDLKIWNFGRAARFGGNKYSSPAWPYTERYMAPEWYTAPEMLQPVGEKKDYSSEVDMWSVGCIMAELVLNKVLFRGKANREDQLNEIDLILNPYSNKTSSSISFAKFLLKEDGFDLLKGLLTYDPTKRITAESALNHVWFHDEEIDR